MSTWVEGVFALLVVAALGTALLLFTGESLGDDDTTVAESVAIDQQAAARGQTLAESTGCLQCHTIDGTPSSGPTWKGLAGSSRPLVTGETATADDAYLFNSIVSPSSQVVQGYDAIMPQDYGDTLTEGEVEDLVEYIKTLAS